MMGYSETQKLANAAVAKLEASADLEQLVELSPREAEALLRYIYQTQNRYYPSGARIKK